MSDSISRQAVINVLMETIAPPSFTLDTLVMRVDAIPSADISAGWVPVTERLPEEGLTVLTFDTNGDIEFGAYEDGKWEWLAESCADYWTRNDGVIAWMPLPMPYKGGESDG